jgi:hypothetical protein
MSINDVFNRFVEEHGGQAMWDHLVQMWWYVMLNDEASILQLIDTLKKEYEDPEKAEIALIALWMQLKDSKKYLKYPM